MATMEALYYKAYGSPSTYIFSTLPKPTISKPDHVLIKVYATSLNPIDYAQSSGNMKLMLSETFPVKIGFDVSGVVEEVGSSVTKFKAGDEVVTRLPQADKGSVATYAMTTAEYIVPKPSNLSHVEAACFPLVGMTAYQVLDHIDGGRQEIQGKKVLVPGGLGGAGSIGVQMAKALGAAEVITTVSTGKMERAKKEFAGIADRIIDYKTEDPTQVIPKQSLDFIYDTVGDAVKLMPLLKPSHHIISIATLPSGETIKAALPTTPWLLVQGLNAASWYYNYSARSANVKYDYIFMSPIGSDLSAVMDLAGSGKIKAVIGEVVEGYGDGAEDRLREAFEWLSKGGAKNGGKIVVKMVA